MVERMHSPPEPPVKRRRGNPNMRIGGPSVNLPLDLPQPGFNDGSFLRAPSHQGWIGVELLEIAAYRNDVGNRRTAIEFEYRNHAIRIHLLDLGSLHLAWPEKFAVIRAKPSEIWHTASKRMPSPRSRRSTN